jgi:hypothetical protein
MSLVIDKKSFGEIVSEYKESPQDLNAIINSGIDLNIPDKHGDLLLNQVLGGELNDRVPILLAKGANPLAKDAYGKNAFFSTVETGFWELFCTHCQVDLLSQSTETYEGNSLIEHIIVSYFSDSSLPAVTYLLDRGMPANLSPNFFDENYERDPSIVGFFFDRGILPVNGKEGDTRSPLMKALFKHKLPLAGILLRNGATLDSLSFNQLISVMEASSYEEVKTVLLLPLVYQRLEQPINGWTRGHLAAAFDMVPELQTILEKDTSWVNSPIDPMGRTPLHLAYSEIVVFLLLMNGANPNSKDENGKLPWSTADLIPPMLEIFRQPISKEEKITLLENAIKELLTTFQARLQQVNGVTVIKYIQLEIPRIIAFQKFVKQMSVVTNKL